MSDKAKGSIQNRTITKMKKLLVSLVLLSVAVDAFAQGLINFQNRTAIGKGKPIYGVNPADPYRSLLGDDADYSGRTKLRGIDYIAGLFVEKGEAWVLIGTSAFRSSDADAGLLIGSGVVRPDGIQPGDVVNLVIRVWDSRVPSWDDIQDHKYDSYARGNSAEITGYVVNHPNPSSPILTKSLIDAGLQSFALYIVPEPSVIALGALGLGALLLRRRM
jgi:hypothetical protein